MNVKILSLILSLVLITGTGLVMAGCAEEVAPPIVLKFATRGGEQMELVQRQKQYFDEMERLCGGKIKIEYYFSESLVKGGQEYYATVANICQLSVPSPAYMKGIGPLTMVAGIPFPGIKSAEHGTYAIDAMRGKYFEAEYPEVKLLHVFLVSPFEFFLANNPVYTMEDMSGRKLRVSAGMPAEMAKALGAVPVSVSMGEWYSATSTGLVEGAFTCVQPIIDFKIYEVIKYATLCRATNIPYITVMNLETWESLPPDVQQIWEEGSMYGAQLQAKVHDEQEEEYYQVMRDAGAEIYQLPPEELVRWQAACAPIADEWAEEMNAKGLPGTEVVQVFRQYIAYFAKELGLE